DLCHGKGCHSVRHAGHPKNYSRLSQHRFPPFIACSWSRQKRPISNADERSLRGERKHDFHHEETPFPPDVFAWYRRHRGSAIPGVHAAGTNALEGGRCFTENSSCFCLLSSWRHHG